MTLAIVVPVLNEIDRVPVLLELSARAGHCGIEALFVDGGSSDGSAEALRQGGAAVLESPRGRAIQMNAGAVATSGDILLFLHADTELPAGAERAVASGLAETDAVWGRFDASIEGESWLLRIVAVAMNWRSRITGIATGDQAIFVRREAFESAGGFPQQALMEDVELCRRLRRQSRPVCLRQRVMTSGRRWHTRGVIRTILLMWELRFRYWLGSDPEQLADRYRS